MSDSTPRIVLAALVLASLTGCAVASPASTPGSSSQPASADTPPSMVSTTTPPPTAAVTTPGAALTMTQLKSVRVPSLCDHKPGRLTNGVLEGNGNNGQVALDVGKSKLGTIIPGQPGGAAAVFSCSQGGVSWPDWVLFYDNQGKQVGALDSGTIGSSPGRQIVSSVAIGGSDVTVKVVAVPLKGDNEQWGSSAATATYAWDAASSSMKRSSLTISRPDATAKQLAKALDDRDSSAAGALVSAQIRKELWPQGDQKVTFTRCVGATDADLGEFVGTGQRGCILQYWSQTVGTNWLLVSMALEGSTWKATKTTSLGD